MGTKLINNPVQLLTFTDNTIDTYVADAREMFVDNRTGTPVLRVGDGVTPGGKLGFPDIMSAVATPTIITPIDGATGINNQTTITADSFLGIKSDGTESAHSGTYWQIADVSDFSTIFWESGLDNANLTSIDLAAEGVTLEYNTTYYVRVRYLADNGDISEWSNIVSFTVETAFKGIEISIVTASDGVAYDYFGQSIKISSDGTMALIGAWGDDNANGSNAGCVYVYDIDPTTGVWTEQQQIIASDGAAYDNFGISVALSSDKALALVGARADDNANGTDAGCVYVYDINPTTGVWTEQQQIIASDGAAVDWFGMSLALSADGSLAIVGALGNDNANGTNAGCVYVYDINPTTGVWTEQQKILASDGAADDSFGSSVAISADGTMALIGAYGDDNANGTDAGKVYIYDIDLLTNTWTEQQKIMASDGIAGDYFGMSVALSADKTMAAVGAYDYSNASGTDAGKVYIYDIDPVTNTWTELMQIIDNSGPANYYFGTSLAISDDKTMVLIGEGGAGNGAVYIYN